MTTLHRFLSLTCLTTALATYTMGQETTIFYDYTSKAFKKDDKPLTEAVRIQTGTTVLLRVEKSGTSRNFRVTRTKGTGEDYSFTLDNRDKPQRIPVVAGEALKVQALDGTKLEAEFYITEDSRRDGPFRLDLGYAFFGMADHEFFKDASGNIRKNSSRNLGDVAALITHYVAPERVSKRVLGGAFGGLGYGSDEVAFAFSFGIPAPGTEGPVRYLAGLSILFGKDRNVGFTFGAAFGKVARLRSDLSVGGTAPEGDIIPTAQRTVTSWFIGITLKAAG